MTLIIINSILKILIAISLIAFISSVFKYKKQEESVSIDKISANIACFLILSMTAIIINVYM
jgi:hypothetical protein